MGLFCVGHNAGVSFAVAGLPEVPGCLGRSGALICGYLDQAGCYFGNKADNVYVFNFLNCDLKQCYSKTGSLMSAATVFNNKLLTGVGLAVGRFSSNQNTNVD
ncbi:hypothetical protein AVEN_141349-1 [Araneus ventricosus]|uniref:Uncharacterized protein n=1 Tax=Araneus ventricosus TaxID=182803 RepID=A0A4Y2N4Y7_ARAVE|nr:hypothetical protein AVEN_141349-1 [Araneus ventricosus]